jgi:hypothetical protein
MTARRFEVPPIYEVDVQHLTRSLEGMRFPAQRWQILAWAEHNGAGMQLRAALQFLPERTYPSVSEIARIANAAFTRSQPPSSSR